jgi:calcineurin-like phosphoesterase
MYGGMSMELKVLAVGDVVGNPGLERIRRSLRQLRYIHFKISTAC